MGRFPGRHAGEPLTCPLYTGHGFADGRLYSRLTGGGPPASRAGPALRSRLDNAQMTDARAASDTSDQNSSADDHHRADPMPPSQRVTIHLTGTAAQALRRHHAPTG